MKGCDLMDPRFTCYVSTDRFLTLCVQCQGVAVFSVGGWLCSVSGGGCFQCRGVAVFSVSWWLSSVSGVAVFSARGWLCSVSGGGWHKLAHRDISAGFMLCRRGMGM